MAWRTAPAKAARVKDGPWWGSVWRQATVMDMISYVGLKNLLIGAALFWLLAFTGLWTLA